MLELLPSVCDLEIQVASGSKPIFHSAFPSSFCKVDWLDELRLIATAVLLAGIIIYILRHPFITGAGERLASLTDSYFRQPRSSSSERAGPICGPRLRNPDNDFTLRTAFTDDSVAIYAWPSRGGVIILQQATCVDFEFLGLDAIDPPERRERGQGSFENESEDILKQQEQQREDLFCQRLLLLGAKWWDNEERCRFVTGVAEGLEPSIADLEEGRVEEPTLRERRWIRVGWEEISTEGTATASSRGDSVIDGVVNSDENSSGGLWVLDCDTTMYGILDEDKLVPVDAGRLCLAGSMAERCEILKRLGATFFRDLKEYNGDTTFLRAWEWKWEGEIGEMLKSQ